MAEHSAESRFNVRAIQSFYLALFATLAALWLWADTSWVGAQNYFVWRSALSNLTGVLGMAAMSVGMILSVRPKRMEPQLGGLDKMYRLHKWLGISGLVLSVVHWALAKSPGFLIGLGWVAKPGQRVRGEESVELFKFFLSQRKLAETVGEYAFYVMCVLLVLALVKRFPYKHFFKTHRWMAVVYLALVLHGVVVMKFNYWAQPLGLLMAALMLLGSAAAVVSLFRRVGIHRRAVATVEALEHHPESQVLRVDLRLRGQWDGHAAGQFAFITFDSSEGPHPYTIASAWQDDGHMFFLIKESGDYTKTLRNSLTVGQSCTVEGPYGHFVFDTDTPRQIWVAGGIGITPFVARMRALSAKQTRHTPEVDLFWATRKVDAEGLRRVKQDAAQANVRLHLRVDGQGDPVDARAIKAAVPGWEQADIWFCGPAGFGAALRDGLVSSGLAGNRFHQELFEMR